MKNKIRLTLLVSACIVSFGFVIGAYAHGDDRADYKGETIMAAVPCPMKLHLRDGFYIGAGVGYDAYGVRQTLTAADDSGGPIGINPKISVKGWNGSLFGGYGQYFDRIYFGGEIFANFSNATTTYGFMDDTATYSTKINVRESYGASLLPGIRLNSTSLLYGRIGYVRTAFKIQEIGTSPAGNLSVPTNKWGNGVQYGIGLETAIHPCVSLRGEYTFTSYSSIASDVNTRFSSANNQFVLSAIYRFA